MKIAFSNINLVTKVILLGVILILSFAILSEAFIVPFIGSSLENEAMRKTRNLVETSIGIVQYYYNLYKSGKMTEDEAKEMAKLTLKNLRYGNGDYFWINDYTPVEAISSVSTLSSHISEAISQTSLAVQQISTTSQGVASGAQETAKNVTSASTEVESISKNIEELAQNASNVEKSAMDTVRFTDEGRLVIEELNKGFSQTMQATNSVVKVMDELELAAGEIGRIVETISSISSQTNLSTERSYRSCQGRGSRKRFCCCS